MNSITTIILEMWGISFVGWIIIFYFLAKYDSDEEGLTIIDFLFFSLFSPLSFILSLIDLLKIHTKTIKKELDKIKIKWW